MRSATLLLLGLALFLPLAPALPPAIAAHWAQTDADLATLPLGVPLPTGAHTQGGGFALPYNPSADVVVPVASNQDEFSIAANPLNPDNLVAGANDYCCSAVKAGFFTTFDGGKTWTHGIIPTPGNVCSGDPALAFDKEGTAWYIGISGFCGDGIESLFASKSTDGGRTWTTTFPVRGNGEFEDKPMVTTDARNGDILISWTVFGGADITVIASHDHGATWTPRIRLGGGQFSTPAIGPEGNYYVSWASGSNSAFARSTDGGKTWTVTTPFHGLSMDAGAVPFRHFAYPVLAAAQSGPHKGRLYMVSPGRSQTSAATGGDLAVQTSDDGGATWTVPEFLPRPGTQLMPWVAVAPDGTAGIAYMDTVLDPGSWVAPTRAAAQATIVQSLSLQDPTVGAGWETVFTTSIPSTSDATGGFNFWGDYQGLAVGADNVFHPAFGDARDKVCECGANNGFPDFGTASVSGLAP